MSPQTAQSCEGDGEVGPFSPAPPGELAADEQAEGVGPVSLNFGLSLLLVDSDLCKGNEALLCFGLKAVVMCSSEVVLVW